MHLLEGGGTYSDPVNGERAVRAGDAILVFPGQIHSYQRSQPELPWTVAFLELDGQLFRDLEGAGEINRREPVIHPGLSHALSTQFDELLRDYLTAAPGEEAIYCARAFLLLSHLLDAHRKHVQGTNRDAFVEKACARLSDSLDEALDLSQVARSFGMSERTFRRRCTEQVGVAPARYRLLQRVGAAKTMLNEGRSALEAISAKLGYYDVSAFNKHFKQITGTTPARFCAMRTLVHVDGELEITGKRMRKRSDAI